MRILFTISGLLWSWLVGRCLALGINTEIYKLQSFNADSWYNLTPIHFKIPTKIIKYSPIIVAILSIPLLLADDDIIHSITVITLVSEHFYIPMFIARIYKNMTVWSVANIVLNIALICMIRNQIFIAWMMQKVLLHIWFTFIELQLGDKIVYEIAERSRQPRV